MVRYIMTDDFPTEDITSNPLRIQFSSIDEMWEKRAEIQQLLIGDGSGIMPRLIGMENCRIMVTEYLKSLEKGIKQYTEANPFDWSITLAADVDITAPYTVKYNNGEVEVILPRRYFILFVINNYLPPQLRTQMLLEHLRQEIRLDNPLDDPALSAVEELSHLRWLRDGNPVETTHASGMARALRLHLEAPLEQQGSKDKLAAIKALGIPYRVIKTYPEK
jgi:hypothetical protein